jgi:hypothetical protein
MAADSTSCPYCNAIMPVSQPTTSSPAPTCPRCGEKLPARLLHAIATEPTAPPAGADYLTQVDLDSLRASEQRPSKKTIRGVVVGVMAIMALLSFLYAWNTVETRRARDPKMPSPLPPPAERRVPPIELAALGYLPPETSVIAAVHVAQAERTPAGKELLKRFRLGTAISVADLDKWTGIKLNDIDHAVLGVTVDNRVLPPVVLVVQTRRPYDAAQVRQALKVSHTTELGTKTLHHFTPAVGTKLSFAAVLWFASPTTVVVGLAKNDLEKVPERPATEASQLSGPVRAVIKERLGQADAWLAGHVEKWDAVSLLLGLFLEKDGVQTLSRVRSFAFGLQFDDGVRLNGAARCADSDATELLVRKWGRLVVPEGDALPKELRPMIQELADTYQRRNKDGWLEIEARASGILAPAKGQAEAAEEEASRKLAQIGVALHSYHDTHGSFPTMAGKPTLSWRVALLPFVQQADLYRQFKLDQPWDSAENKKLLDKMPAIYLDPRFQKADDKPTVTYFQGFTGDGGVFGVEGGLDVTVRNIGFILTVSSKFLLAEAGEAVPWTKPDDLRHDLTTPLPPLGGPQRGDFLALLVSGEVRRIPAATDAKTLRSMIECNGAPPARIPGELLRPIGSR